jgi:acetylornithine deacetylase/succinyl-diaminopimelate desuccinylase-like protein
MKVCGSESILPFVKAQTPSKCGSPFENHEHQHLEDRLTISEPPLGPSPVGVSDALRREVVSLTQELVRIDSSPTNFVPGQNEVIQRMSDFASQAGLDSQIVDTVNGKHALIVTLAGSCPELGTVGFVHHSDVVQPEGEWKLGEPFSGAITHDESGREIMVGRGTIDTKGPAAQILVAMKHLKQSGEVPERSLKLFIFPDEEFGGKDGADFIAKNRPELVKDVQSWVVEGSGVLDPSFIGGLFGDQPVPYVAVAQKYTIPMQLELKHPTTAGEAIDKTFAGLDRADKLIEGRSWSYLGSKSETKEAMTRMAKAIGGFKGFMIRHFYNWGFMQKKMGKGNAAANRTDFCKTDFYLSNNQTGKPQGPNVKPSSASAVFKLDLQGEAKEAALADIRKAAGTNMKVEAQVDGSFRLSLPQENYHGGNHGSTADRRQDAVDVTHQALSRVEKQLKKAGLSEHFKLENFYTSKSQPSDATFSDGAAGVQSKVTLDLRVAVGENPKQVIADLQKAVGADFNLNPIMGPEQLDAHVRRLSYQSPLFQKAENSIHKVYGEATPVLFGNTTASNDTRFLMDVNPNCETLTFVPILNTSHGAHGPDEAVTTRSLIQGVDWTVDFMRAVGNRD